MLSEDDVKLFTEGRNFGHLATLMPDGSPHVSIVWIDHADGFVLVNTVEGRVKPRNVRRDPRVAISVQDPVEPSTGIMVRGRVERITRDGAEEHIDAMERKYRGRETYPFHDPARPRLLLYIRPERVVRL
jgi:PPOX class probable F420-dependent enzyme